MYLTSKKVYFDITTGKVYPKMNLKPNMSKGKNIDEYDDKWFETLNDRDLATVQNYINNRKEFADGGGVGVETILFAVKKGEPDWNEVLITNNPAKIEDAKKWALANGFDRLRVSKIDMNEKPDFEKTFAKGGSLSEVYDVDINYKQIKGYLGRFPMTEKTAEKLSDTFYFMYFDLYDTTDKKPMSYNQVSKIITESMKEKGLYENGGFMDGVYAKGGGIPNNYEGRTPEEVWNMWSLTQKEHFLSDHLTEYKKSTPKNSDYKTLSRLSFKDVPFEIKKLVYEHTNMGQYAKGGNINVNKTKMRKQKLKKGDTVTIYGKRWFDRVNGNTYHTAEVEVNGTTLGKSPMTYGYDEQYLETGKEILLQHYDLPRGMTERSPMWQLRDNGVTLTKYVTDGLKRDLAKGGGVKTKNGQTYNYGRVWTKDHNEFDKGSDHEVDYRKNKKLSRGGALGQSAKVQFLSEEYASEDLIDELKSKLKTRKSNIKDNVEDNDVIAFAYTDYGGSIIDKYAIEYFLENHPNNIVVESQSYNGKNAFVFGKPAKEWMEETEDYPLGFEDFESYFYDKENEDFAEGIDYFITDLKRDYSFDEDEVRDSLLEQFSGYFSVTTSGLDYSEDRMIDYLKENELIEENLAKGGGVKTKNGQTYNYGRVWTNDHNEFDKGSDHEVEYRRKKKFELGGNVVTDLAGHTGGSLGTGDPSMLDGFSNTAYTGLVGETGAMSSGEMFAKGGSVNSKFDLSGYKKFRTFNDLEEAKEYVDMDRKKYSRAKESVVIKEGNKFQVWVIPASGIETGNRVYEAGGGLPDGSSQSYMITESLGNPAQHFAKGGGVRTINGQTYNYGRVWTKDHNEFDKGSDHEVEYRRKQSSFFAKGGAMEKIKYDDVLEVLKEKLEDATEELPREYEFATDFKGEEVEKQSRDGFIAFTDGGYEVTWFENMSMFSGSGYGLPTKPLDDEMQRQIAYNYQLAKETFIENYPDIAEELGEDNIDYNSLYEAGYESEAEELSEMEMNYDGDDTIMCEIGAYYYDTENYRGVDEKHTIRLYGLVNLESPYHRRGNLDDSYDIDITFDSISELKEKVDAGLKEIIDWFDGKYYNDSDAEMKIRRMADGGFMDGVYAKGGEIEFQHSNIRIVGTDMDSNGNRVVKVSFPNQRAFSIQTNGDLPKTHNLLEGYNKNTNFSDKEIELMEDEIIDYVKNYGSANQKKSLRLSKSYLEKNNFADGGFMNDVYSKGGKVSPFKNIMETNTITEKEINLIKMRMNNDKVDEATQEVIDYIWDNSPQLTPDQNKKGIDYLRNLWKSPTGKERTNNPFGYREQDALETFEYFELRGFYDAGNRYRKFYVPLYTCVGADSNFEYAFYGGEVNILG